MHYYKYFLLRYVMFVIMKECLLPLSIFFKSNINFFSLKKVALGAVLNVRFSTKQ